MPTLLELAYEGAYIGTHGFAELWRYDNEVYMVSRVTGQVYQAPLKLVYDETLSAA